METTIPVASSAAITVAAAAAVCDWRSREIPNWITLPPLALAPLAYAVFIGVDHGALSLLSMLVCAFGPYVLFRRHGIGGGDVKLFGALGAITGFDVVAGLEIELVSFLVALVFALGGLAWRGALIRTLRNGLAVSLNPFLPKLWRRDASPTLLTPIRMGGAILLATAFCTVPSLWLAWSAS